MPFFYYALADKIWPILAISQYPRLKPYNIAIFPPICNLCRVDVNRSNILNKLHQLYRQKFGQLTLTKMCRPQGQLYRHFYNLF